MVNKEVRDTIAEMFPDTLLFGGKGLTFGQAYDNSIIGVDNNGRVVYVLEKMVEEFMKENRCDYDDAIDFIEYNTLGSLPPMDDGRPYPIVITMAIAVNDTL